MSPIKYNLDELISIIPDEMFYIITNRTYCKDGINIYSKGDEEFEECQEIAKDYKDNTYINTFAGKIAYYWYMKNPSQQQYIIIDGMYKALGVSSYEAKRRLSAYGLLDSKDTLTELESRTYLVPIYGDTVEELEQSFKSYVEDFLPEDWSNIELVLTEDYNLLELNTLNELLSRCNPRLDGYPKLNVNQELLKCNALRDKINSSLEEFKGYGITKFINVENLLHQANEEWLRGSSLAYDLFNEAAKQVLREADKVGRNKVMIYTYELNGMYTNFATYMKYFYGIAALDMSIKHDYISALCNLLYSPNQMLAADRLLYIRNFPTYVVKDSDYGTNIFYTVNRTCKAFTTFVEVDEDLAINGELTSDVLDVMDTNYELINITNYFNFDKGAEENAQADAELKRLFHKFYQLIKRNKVASLDYPTPCNTCIVKTRSKMYLARIDSISEMNLEGYVVSLELRTSKIHSIKSDDEFRYWLPLDMFNDVELGKQLTQKVLMKSRVWDTIVNKNEIHPRYTSNKATFYYRYLLRNTDGKFSPYRIPNTFVEANLNATSAKLARNSKIWEVVFKNSPKLLEQLTSFYCTDVTNPWEKKIRVDESMISRNYIEGGLYE